MELKGDEDRVEAFRRGDREMLRDVYRAYRDEIEAMLRGGFTFTSDGRTMRFQGVREPFRLREMLQDAFLHAFRDRVREQYDPSRSYGPYLKTVVRNHLIDRFRREQLESDLFVAADDLAHDDETGRDALDRVAGGAEGDDSPETTSLRRELVDAIETFIDALDDDERRILEDYMLGDATQHGMAEELGVSRHQVRKRIRQIRRELLGHLKREGFVGGTDVDELFRNIAALAVAEVL